MIARRPEGRSWQKITCSGPEWAVSSSRRAVAAVVSFPAALSDALPWAGIPKTLVTGRAPELGLTSSLTRDSVLAYCGHAGRPWLDSLSHDLLLLDLYPDGLACHD